MTHAERSKSMNSRAFSCGDRSVSAQPAGGGGLSLVAGLPATCRSLKTARPQYVGPVLSGGGGALITGVSNEKYIVAPAIPDPSDVIHGCEGVFAGPTFALKRGW